MDSCVIKPAPLLALQPGCLHSSVIAVAAHGAVLVPIGMPVAVVQSILDSRVANLCGIQYSMSI
jgi:hypothetical protein